MVAPADFPLRYGGPVVLSRDVCAYAGFHAPGAHSLYLLKATVKRSLMCDSYRQLPVVVLDRRFHDD